MYIIRDGNRIRLTREELETAYRAREHEYLLEDARRQLCCYLFGAESPEEMTEGEFARKDAEIRGRYGTGALGLLFDEELLETLVESFCGISDCNIPENSSWNTAAALTMHALMRENAGRSA